MRAQFRFLLLGRYCCKHIAFVSSPNFAMAPTKPKRCRVA
jgi:hypothetical protein